MVAFKACKHEILVRVQFWSIFSKKQNELHNSSSNSLIGYGPSPIPEPNSKSGIKQVSAKVSTV